MKIKYSGNKAVEFIKELENFDINNINIEIYDEHIYFNLPGTFLYIDVFVVDNQNNGKREYKGTIFDLLIILKLFLFCPIIIYIKN